MNLSKLLALGLFVTLGAAGTARAQSVNLSFDKQTRHGAFSIGLSAPLTSECRPAPRRVWVPGHFQEVERKVWVEGVERRVWVEPVYATRYDDCGRPVSVLVRQGFWDTVCDPGHFETRVVRVWVDGFWKTEVASYGAPSLDVRYSRYDDRRHSSSRGYSGRGAYERSRHDDRGRSRAHVEARGEDRYEGRSRGRLQLAAQRWDD